MKHKDERATLTNAILSDIKVIKLYGWEKTFMEKVHAIRKQELQALKRSQILFSASLASFHSSTFLVSGSSSYTKHTLLLPLLFVILSGQFFPVGLLKIISVWSSWWSHRRSWAPVNQPHRLLLSEQFCEHITLSRDVLQADEACFVKTTWRPPATQSS